MILGLLLSCIAGALISLQNIFNSKVNVKSGKWLTTSIVLGTGFLASLLVGFIIEGKYLFVLHNMQPWYWFSGVIGVGVVISLMQSVKSLGPTYAISIVLTSQLIFALVWDSLGLLGLEKVPFTLKQLIGVSIIIAGILVFKLGKGLKRIKQVDTIQPKF